MTQPAPVGDYTAADLVRWTSTPYNERNEQDGRVVILVDGDLDDDGAPAANYREIVRVRDCAAFNGSPAVAVEIADGLAWEHFQSAITTEVDIDAAAGIVHAAIEAANDRRSIGALRLRLGEPARNVPDPDDTIGTIRRMMQGDAR